MGLGCTDQGELRRHDISERRRRVKGYPGGDELQKTESSQYTQPHPPHGHNLTYDRFVSHSGYMQGGTDQ